MQPAAPPARSRRDGRHLPCRAYLGKLAVGQDAGAAGGPRAAPALAAVDVARGSVVVVRDGGGAAGAAAGAATAACTLTWTWAAADRARGGRYVDVFQRQGDAGDGDGAAAEWAWLGRTCVDSFHVGRAALSPATDASRGPATLRGTAAQQQRDFEAFFAVRPGDECQLVHVPPGSSEVRKVKLCVRVDEKS